VLREIGISPSTFHDWRMREAQPSERRVRDGELAARIREIHAASGGVYGSPRIHAMLAREGERVSRKRVERLMREAALAGVSPARKVRTTVRNPADALSDDLVKRDFTACAPNRLWVTDLTLIDTGEGPLWLASIRDAFSRRIVAWHTGARADAELVCTVLEYALASRDYERGQLVHHADHGGQYTSIKLTTRLLKAGIKASMGTVGDSFDNALAENLWSVLKTECVRRTTFATRADAELALFAYIDGFYNTRRIQQRLGWRSPDEFEAAHHAGELTARELTALTEAAEHRRARRQAARAAKLSSVAQPPPPADTEGPDTAGAPTGVAGSDPSATATRRRSGREERPQPPPTRSPRERRGPGQRPGTPPQHPDNPTKQASPNRRTPPTPKPHPNR
jgi:transposase InsO family protein